MIKNMLLGLLAGAFVDVGCLTSGNATVKALGLPLAFLTFFIILNLRDAIDRLK